MEQHGKDVRGLQQLNHMHCIYIYIYTYNSSSRDCQNLPSQAPTTPQGLTGLTLGAEASLSVERQTWTPKPIDLLAKRRLWGMIWNNWINCKKQKTSRAWKFWSKMPQCVFLGVPTLLPMEALNSNLKLQMFSSKIHAAWQPLVFLNHARHASCFYVDPERCTDISDWHEMVWASEGKNVICSYQAFCTRLHKTPVQIKGVQDQIKQVEPP